MDKQFEDELAVVVGATGAFGRSIVQRLLNTGLRVVAVARSEASVGELAEQYQQVIPCIADIADDSAIDATQQAVAGRPLSKGDKGAPMFEYPVLKGRPKEQRFELMRTFTDQVAVILGIEPQLVRGRCIQLDPDDWGIGGLPASELRKQEIEQRSQRAQS